MGRCRSHILNAKIPFYLQPQITFGVALQTKSGENDGWFARYAGRWTGGGRPRESENEAAAFCKWVIFGGGILGSGVLTVVAENLIHVVRVPNADRKRDCDRRPWRLGYGRWPLRAIPYLFVPWRLRPDPQHQCELPAISIGTLGVKATAKPILAHFPSIGILRRSFISISFH